MLGLYHSLDLQLSRPSLFARGPEIESWFGVEDGVDPAVDNDWAYLPFMALADGIHAYGLRRLGIGTGSEQMQIHRGFLLLYSAKKSQRILAGNVTLWHIMHPPNRLRQADRSTGRCHKRGGTEGSRCGSR